MGTKKRKNNGESSSVFDYDGKLLAGLHHVDWRETGQSADKTKYGSNGAVKPNEHKKLHKLLVR